MSSSVEIDPQLAQWLLVEGATFIFLDVPTGTEVGIDMKSWKTGERFRGIKMIPPGVHFIYYSACKDGNTAPRMGFFHNFQRKEFVVKKWDAEKEDVAETELSEEEVARYKENIKDLDRFLGPYPYDTWKTWKTLTSHITGELVDKLVPQSGRIVAAEDLILSPKKTESSSTQRSPRRPLTTEEKEEALLPDLQPRPGTELRLTTFPERNFPDGATPAEITKHSLDSSYVFETVVARHDRPEDILGELQFAFVCFLVGQNFSAFEQWKRLVRTFCLCDRVLVKYTSIFSDFITELQHQLEEMQEDFLVDIVSNNNVVYSSLEKLFQNISQNQAVDGRLKTKIQRFQESLTAKFGWEFDLDEEEDDDDAPVIVDEAEIIASEARVRRESVSE